MFLYEAFKGSNGFVHAFDGFGFADDFQGFEERRADPLASDRENVSLHGVGLGVRAYVGDFSMRFEIATSVGDEPVSNGRDPQYFFEFNYGL